MAWYYTKGGQRVGPVDDSVFRALIANGTVDPEDLVWQPGFAEWQKAGSVPGLYAPAALPPAAGGPPAVPAPPAARPTSVTVFGILNIVFGGLGLLCEPVGVAIVLLAPQAGASPTWYTGAQTVSAVISLACSVWLLVLGIGLLKQQGWARSGCVAYAWLMIVLTILNLGVLAVAAVTHALPAGAAGFGGLTVAAGVAGGLTALIYPILLLVFMRKPHVVAACGL